MLRPRIYDPGLGPGDQRIYSWLASETFDTAGNAIIFEYKPEDSSNVDITMSNEANRTDLTRSTNQYLKRIRYGNRIPARDLQTWAPTPAVNLPQENWMFSIVLDYGEHDIGNPTPNESKLWDCRLDPFSTFRSCFEVGTYRLCRRIFMFHHFVELGAADTLVASTSLEYQSDPCVTYLKSAVLVGYGSVRIDGTQIQKTLPPLTFEYSTFPTDAEISDLPVNLIDQRSLSNVPIGLGNSQYQWADLDMEGISGILTEQGRRWFYKRNMSRSEDYDGKTDSQVIFGDVEVCARTAFVFYQRDLASLWRCHEWWKAGSGQHGAWFLGILRERD